MKKATLFSAILLCTFGICNAQLKDYNSEKNAWFPGMVKLVSGEKSSGQVNYNFVTDLVKVKSKGELNHFSASELQYFIILDSTKTKHKFYSITYDLHGIGQSGYCFFKVLHEASYGAILSKRVMESGDAIGGGANRKASNNSALRNMLGSSPKTGRANQQISSLISREIIYIVDPKFGVQEYLLGKQKRMKKGKWVDETEENLPNQDSQARSKALESDGKYRFANEKKPLKNLFDSDYSEILNAAENQSVKLKTIEGTIQLLEYWSKHQ